MSRELLKTNVELPDRELVLLADKIVKEIEAGKQALAISINETIKTTYWKIGRHIVEFEQQGGRRAKYGTALLSNLARILRARVGRGYSHPNLNNMRKFYIMYPNFQMSDKSGPILEAFLLNLAGTDDSFADGSRRFACLHLRELGEGHGLYLAVYVYTVGDFRGHFSFVNFYFHSFFLPRFAFFSIPLMLSK